MSVVESDADRIRRNDKSLTEVWISCEDDRDIAEIFDALKNNTVVKQVTFHKVYSVQLNQEALDKLSEVMKCNKSVTILDIYLGIGLLRERLFAVMATGWSSIQELRLEDAVSQETLSITDSENISNFILQSENLRTLHLGLRTVESRSKTLVIDEMNSFVRARHAPW
jgi:hypothetical protein